MLSLLGNLGILMKIPVIVFAALCFATPSLANVTCVQQQLTDAGFDPGPVDGALGKKTRTAAAAFAERESIELPALTAETSWKWCSALRRAAMGDAADDLPEVNGLTALDFDVTGLPPIVPSKANTETFWNLHKTSPTCLPERPELGPSMSIKLEVLSPQVFTDMRPDAIYPAPTGKLESCRWQRPLTVRLGDRLPEDAPPPVPVTDPEEAKRLSEVYGSNDVAVDIASMWFIMRLTDRRYDPEGTAGEELKARLVEWAKAGAYSTPDVQGDNGTVTFTYATAMAGLLNAYVETAPTMTPDERAIVGPWINKMMVKIAGASEPFRTQNHEAGWGLMTAMWGLAVGDHDAVQHAIDRYKLAINDMRPDGTFAVDHSRGGSGLGYQTLISGDLVILALLLKHSLDLDLFSYSVDGRSIHDAMGYLLVMGDDYMAASRKYALPCDKASGAPVDQPGRDYEWNNNETFQFAAFAASYVELFPDHPNAKKLLARNNKTVAQAAPHPVFSAAPSCMFNTSKESVKKAFDDAQ